MRAAPDVLQRNREGYQERVADHKCAILGENPHFTCNQKVTSVIVISLIDGELDLECFGERAPSSVPCIELKWGPVKRIVKSIASK